MRTYLSSYSQVAALILILLLGFTHVSESQINRRQIKKNQRKISNFKGRKNVVDRYSYLGISANALNYFGDLAPYSRLASTDISFTRPALGLSYSYRLGPFYTLRAAFSYGTLRGSDYRSADPFDDLSQYRYVRNLSFRNRIKELSVVGIFDLYRNDHSFITRRHFVPYAYIGLAAFHHNPKALVNPESDLPEAGTWVALRELGTEGQYSDLPEDDANFGIEPYSLVQISVPFGIGFRYKLTSNFDLEFESGLRILFTDYIDDVSRNYVDLNLLPSDLSREMSDRSLEVTDAETGDTRDAEVVYSVGGTLLDSPGGYQTFAGYGRSHSTNIRGNRTNNDIYIVTSIRFTYILGSSFRKAKFR